MPVAQQRPEALDVARLDDALRPLDELSFERDLATWNLGEGDACLDWREHGNMMLPTLVKARDDAISQGERLRGLVAGSDPKVEPTFLQVCETYASLVEDCTFIGREPPHALRRLLARVLSAALLYPALAQKYEEVDGDQDLADAGIVAGQFASFRAKRARERRRV